mgnify:CR=1 FL=1
MTDFIFANNAKTSLAQSISATTTVINVSSGEGGLFPSPTSGEQFAVTLVDAATGLINEICYCTSRSSDQLTVIRGQEGTTAQSWSAGDVVAQYVTAGSLEGFLSKDSADNRYVSQGGTQTDYAGKILGVRSADSIPWVGYSANSVNYKIYLQPYGSYATQTALATTNSNLATESATRAAADGALQAAITAETSNRQSADANLSSGWIAVTSSSSVQIPSWASRVEIVAVGGGGGGCGCQGASLTQSVSGGGGASGSYVHGIYSISSGSTLSVSIGSGGIGGVGSGGGGGDGTATSVSFLGTTLFTASGGAGGRWGSVQSSAGGEASMPSTPVPGVIVSTGGSFGSDGQCLRWIGLGNGGTSPFGGAGRAGASAGKSATGYGSGGGGAYDAGLTGSVYRGGNGFQGVALLRFIP